MDEKKYQSDRKVLLDEAQRLLNEGVLDEFETKRQEIEALDNKYDESCKALANFNALNERTAITNISSRSVKVEGGAVLERMGAEAPADDDIFASTEYRRAFMNHVVKGETIPAKFKNADANTLTTDIGVLIPTTVMQQIIEQIESTGMILSAITRTSYKGGVKIPTSSVKPVASWVAEGESSEKQKKTVGYIDFAYYKLRCAVSLSLEVDTMAMPVFEAALINNVVEAMTKAIEQAIINGSGTSGPKGILTETPKSGQSVTVSVAKGLTYQTLIDAESALPLAYESAAVWFMTKKTFLAFAGMVDDNGQPIARTNYGISGKPERSLFGRSVILNDYMASYTKTAGQTIAFLFNPKDYILNTNLNMTVKRYEDNDTDDIITKAIMLVDGKVVDTGSLVTLKTVA